MRERERERERALLFCIRTFPWGQGGSVFVFGFFFISSLFFFFAPKTDLLALVLLGVFAWRRR